MVPSESVWSFDTQNSRSLEIKITTQAKQEAEQERKNDWEKKEIEQGEMRVKDGSCFKEMSCCETGYQ